MADIIDQAQAQAELINREFLKIKKPEGPAPTGYCLNCAEPLPEGMRWCGAACRDDWEELDTLLRQRGL